MLHGQIQSCVYREEYGEQNILALRVLWNEDFSQSYPISNTVLINISVMVEY